MDSNVLAEHVLLTAPRVLGLIDRDPASPTYGCCDRNFWSYRLHDVVNARAQEACLLLSMLYGNPFQGNAYCGKTPVFEWILATIRFWASRLNRDGSAVEVYPFERSACATAFSTFATTEALLQLRTSAAENGRQLDAFAVNAGIEHAWERAGKWLARHYSRDVTNQAAAAFAALRNIHRITGKDIFRTAAEHILEDIRDRFERHGCFPEYGGFDIGYETITAATLAWIPDGEPWSDTIRDMITRSVKRLESVIDSAARYDYEDTSRNTQFLYTYAFWRASSPVLGAILQGLRANAILCPLWMDDRYCVAMAVDYLKTFLESKAERRFPGQGPKAGESCPHSN